ncbi:MAG TPA: ribosome maturation factor RimM [Candidatus Limnocylindrales bacterium]
MSRSSSRSSEGGERRLVVGLVRGVRGLRGDVRVEVLTDRPAERFARGAALFREGDDAPLTIASARAVADGPGWWLRFHELPDRTAAESLRDVYLEAAVTSDQALPSGEFYWHEIVGAVVRDAQGRELGRVREVYRAGEAEVYAVRGGPAGAFELPAVRAFIQRFEPRDGEIVVDAEALGIDVAKGER